MTASDPMNLTDYTDILGDLEARGNVPAGFEPAEWTASGWQFRCPACDRFDITDKRIAQLATASLCHTIEGVLAKEWKAQHWDSSKAQAAWAHTVFYAEDRLTAAASAYRAQFGLEVPHA